MLSFSELIAKSAVSARLASEQSQFMVFFMLNSIFRCALLLVLLLGFSACGKPGSEAPTAAKAPAAVPVTLAAAEVRSVPYDITAIGNVEPIASVAVKSRVDGQIVEVHIRDGQDVVKGQLMFQIDPRPFQIQLQQAQSNLARDRALLATATAQEARYRDLLAKNYISQDGYAQVKSNLDVADATVKTDEGSIANAKLQLEFTRIQAPFNGRLGKVEQARGNLVKANDTNSLVVLNQVNPIYVSFSVPEQSLQGIREAMARGKLPVHALDRDGGSAEASGELSFVDNAVDAGTGTIRLRGIFKNPQNTLWPGQFVNVSLRLGEQADALVVPTTAVLTGPKGAFVYVATPENKATLREVTVTRTTPEGVVIGKGLVAGEKVVIDGQSRLTSGASITIAAPATSR
jgi:multidrug efflux system membrane fusion protein